jgi:hypothetical protein
MPRLRLLLPALMLSALMSAAGCKRKPPACNAIANQAPAIPFSAGAAPPMLAGGTIADGVYHATRAEGFNDAPPAGRRMTLEVSNRGRAFAWAGDVLDAAGKRALATVSANATVSASGTWLAVATTCPATGPSPLPSTMVFSATPTTLVLAARDEQGAITSVTTYTRQGGVIPTGFVHPPIPTEAKQQR